MKLTKEDIREKMETNDKWLIRGLIAIYDRQTADEQVSEDTKHNNTIGFNGGDGRWGANFAAFYKQRNFLTKKQINYIRPKMLKYSGQLLKIANGEI